MLPPHPNGATGRVGGTVSENGIDSSAGSASRARNAVVPCGGAPRRAVKMPYQSGFFTTNGNAKYSLKAFRFPFVAVKQAGGVSIWGRTPFGEPGAVIVERRTGDRWAAAMGLRADRYGIFTARLGAPPHGTTAFRARLDAPAELSIPFSLTVPPTRPVAPFGCGGSIPCSRG